MRFFFLLVSLALCVIQKNMKPDKNIWLFVGVGARFPSGAFTNLEKAEAWVAKHKLSGMLSAMPIDQGLFEWAIENNAFNMKPEKLKEKENDSQFIGTCNTASLEHYHYENGIKE
jgi:hypothetical protein